MVNKTHSGNKRQQLFTEMVIGTLVYSVVLGFFDDYTKILYTRSYSVTFAAAIVLQVLTYLTLGIEKHVARWFKQRTGKLAKVGLYVTVWLILLLSKFIFLEVIDFVFGQSVEISGFIGLILIVLSMTVFKGLIDYAYNRLAS